MSVEPDPPDDAVERAAFSGETTDKLARAVSRARIAEKLFATREAVTVGRYRLLEQVGTGGMGIVWGAFDPELDRRVAIKVMKPQVAAARERVVREGHALAKLSHPHVVPVYDVGVVDDQVYLVMEWVQGETLRAWGREPRSVRDVVRAYREAAMGLAAAHDAGLVHRDFKPDNAMIGKDGRVRVLDFGLAQAGGAAGIAGTPAYMAPEQRAGGEQTPAVDQYALGVALREALPDPPPKWLAAIIARATAPEAGARFASMHDVVAALGADPARVLRRRLAIASALGLAGVAFGVGMKAGDDTEERCAGGAAEVAWEPGAREAARTHLVALGPYGAQLAERAGLELDDYARRWTIAQAGACKAHDRGELTDAIYTANLTCLTRAKSALATARDVLATATRDRLPQTVLALRSLPAVEQCRTELAPPPAELAVRVAENGNAVARARVLAFASDPGAIEAGAAAERAANEIGYARQIGRASLVYGLALLFQQDRPAAAQAFDQAARAALEGRDPATAIEALARRVFAIATSNQPIASVEETLTKLDFVLAVAKGLDGDEAFARALLYNNLGTLTLRTDTQAARTWFADAIRVRPPVSRDTFELASIYGNLGLIEPDRAKRDTLFALEGSELEAALGADHPMTLEGRVKAALFIEHPQRSADMLRDACARYARMHAHLVEKIEQCTYELAWLAEERGDAREATDALARITRLVAPEGKLAAAYRDLRAGKSAEAATAMTAFVDVLLATHQFWPTWRSVDARLVVALAADQLGDRPRAIAAAEAALATIDGLGDFARSSFVQRRRGRLLAMLALWGADVMKTRTAAALAWTELAGGYDDRTAALAR